MYAHTSTCRCVWDESIRKISMPVPTTKTVDIKRGAGCERQTSVLQRGIPDFYFRNNLFCLPVINILKIVALSYIIFKA